MAWRHKAGTQLLGKSPLNPSSYTRPPHAVLGESRRQTAADGRVTSTQAGLLEALGPCQGKPRQSHRAMLPFWQNRSRRPETQFIWKRETIPSGTQVPGRNGLSEIQWKWKLLLGKHRALSSRDLRVPYSNVCALCLAQMAFCGTALPWVGCATIFFSTDPGCPFHICGQRTVSSSYIFCRSTWKE